MLRFARELKVNSDEASPQITVSRDKIQPLAAALQVYQISGTQKASKEYCSVVAETLESTGYGTGMCSQPERHGRLCHCRVLIVLTCSSLKRARGSEI